MSSSQSKHHGAVHASIPAFRLLLTPAFCEWSTSMCGALLTSSGTPTGRAPCDWFTTTVGRPSSMSWLTRGLLPHNRPSMVLTTKPISPFMEGVAVAGLGSFSVILRTS